MLATMGKSFEACRSCRRKGLTCVDSLHGRGTFFALKWTTAPQTSTHCPTERRHELLPKSIGEAIRVHDEPRNDYCARFVWLARAQHDAYGSRYLVTHFRKAIRLTIYRTSAK